MTEVESGDVGAALWLVGREAAKVYIFGFSEAFDRSWLSPTIESAFRESREVWFETPPANRSESVEQGLSPVVQALGYDQEKELFDVLGPQLSARTLEVADRYGIGREALEQTRPWFAYFVLNSAYRTSLSEASDHQQIGMPDAVLAQLAQRAGKMIRSEFETDDDVLRYFAEMSETEQRERLEMLLDYLDDDQAGNLDDRLDWISGTLPRDADRFIDRMRRKTPALYRVEHVRRNKQWAERIVTLLSQGGVYFVVIGLNHILGPDSLLKALDEIGITPSAVRHV